MVDVGDLREATIYQRYKYRKSKYDVDIALFYHNGKRYTGAFIQTSEKFTYSLRRHTLFTDARRLIPLLRPHAASVGRKAVQKALTGNFSEPTPDEQAVLNRINTQRAEQK